MTENVWRMRTVLDLSEIFQIVFNSHFGLLYIGHHSIDIMTINKLLFVLNPWKNQWLQLILQILHNFPIIMRLHQILHHFNLLNFIRFWLINCITLLFKHFSDVSLFFSHKFLPDCQICLFEISNSLNMSLRLLKICRSPTLLLVNLTNFG